MRINGFPDHQNHREKKADNVCIDQKKTARERARRGFTLAEMLITVAIIGILAAFGFVAVIRYQKSLKQTELDDTAREIFVAAQNHMTVSRASGNCDTYVAEAEKQPDGVTGNLGAPMGAGGNDGTGPSDYDRSLGSWDSAWADGTLAKDEAHDFRYVTVSADVKNDAGILSMILPDDAIDETLRGNGNILIEYDAETATVYGVWYCKPADLKKATGTSSESIITSIADTKAYQNDNRTDRSSRMKSNPMVGYYGGASSVEKEGKSEESSISAIIENDDRLMLQVAVPEESSGSETKQRSYTVKATVTGQTSGNSKEIILGTSKENPVSAKNSLKGVIDQGSVNNKSRLYFYTLDSVTDGAEGHFAYQFCSSNSVTDKPLIPGENLTITVRLVYDDGTDNKNDNKNDKSGTGKKETLSADSAGNSVTLSCNSLFANGSNSGDNHTARIAYGRHLQNLSTVVSGVNSNVNSGAQAPGSGSNSSASITNAKMLKDLDWSSMTIRFLNPGAIPRFSTSTSAGSGAGTGAYAVSSYNGRWNTTSDSKSASASTSALTAGGNFYSISDSTLTSFNGNGFEISNLKIGAASDKAVSGSGTAASGSGTAPSAGKNGSAGSTYTGLFGYIDVGTADNSTMTIQRLTLKNPTAEKATYAGFVVGKTSRKTSIQNVTVTGDTALSLTATQAAGGILGEAENTVTSILYSKVLSGKTLSITASADNGSNRANINSGINSNNASNAGGILGIQIGGKTGTTGTGTGLSIGNCTVSISGKESSSSANAGNTSNDGQYIQITGGYSAGGILGYCAANELGSNSGASGNNSGYSGAVTIINCSVFGAGNQDLVSAENAAAGLAAYISTSGKVDVENSAASVYVAGSDAQVNAASDGFGGLIGYLNSTGSNSIISKCYVGGRTVEGTYKENTSDNSTQGRYNIRGNGYVGGFIGQVTGSNSLNVENCFTTASAYSGTSASTNNGNGAGTSKQAGSFIANSTNASLSVTSCYATGLTNGTVFVGESVSNSAPYNGNNYYLAGVNKANLTGAGVKGAKVGDAGTPFAEQTSRVRTNKYDTSLEENYPYQVVSGQSVYYGDWVVPKNTQNIDGSFGILYYEIVQHGTGKGAEDHKSVYYHGFVGNAVAGGNVSDVSYKEINTRTTLDETQSPGELNDGLLKAENGGQYVTEDGYILLVSDKCQDDQFKIGWEQKDGSDRNNISDLINNKILIQYDAITKKLKLDGYHAYYFNAENNRALSREKWDNPLFTLTFAMSSGTEQEKYDPNIWKKIVSFTMNPYLADYIYPFGESSTDYQIRSAHQLNILFNTLQGGNYLGTSGSGQGTVVNQTMDISYNNDAVKFTEFGNKASYQSPQLGTMANTYQGKTNQNNYVYKLDNLTQSLLAETTNNYQEYALNNLHITHMSAASLVGNNYGTLSNLIVTDSTFSSASLVKGENTGTIKNCVISNINTDANGIADKNTKIISNIKIENSTIKGSGFVGTNDWGGIIYNSSIDNSSISGNGIADSNNGNGEIIKNIKLTNVKIQKNGLVGYNCYSENNPDVFNESVKISDCKINNAIISGNGAVGSNHGTLQNIELQSVKVNKNGFVGDNVGIIKNCNVINAEIGQNGFASTNSSNGKIENCQLYADSKKYEEYTDKYKNATQQAYYKPVSPVVDNQDKTTIGYDLMVCGLLHNDSDSDSISQNPKTAGFIGDNSAKIYNCSYSGKVYGSDVAAGFFLYNNSGEIEYSYANALVTASKTVAGFGLSCVNGAVNFCHSIGILLSAEQGAGFIYDFSADNWPGSLKNNYSAIWKSNTHNYSFFSSQFNVNDDILNNNIKNCAYLTSIFCEKDKIIENDDLIKSGKITGLSYKELKKNNSVYGSNASEATTNPYYQYTSKDDKVYPFAMPSGMIAYGDWSWNNSSYSIEFNGNGGKPTIDGKEISSINDIDYVVDVTLPDCTAPANSWKFMGWQDQSGNTYKAGEKVSGLATSGTVTLTAQWEINNVTDYKYSGEEVKTYTTQAAGWYKLEVWGADGGNATFNEYNAQGGKGGYTVNYVYLAQNQKIDVYIGGRGQDATTATLYFKKYDKQTEKQNTLIGGWNGGGNACCYSKKVGSAVSYWLFGSGGGASHMAIHSDTLQNSPEALSKYNVKDNSIILVAGGGGGAGLFANAFGNFIDGYPSINAGGYGGGENGRMGASVSNNTQDKNQNTFGTGGTETAGGYVEGFPAKSGNFGQGGSPINKENSSKYDLGAGGGGGWYGGGSSYIDPNSYVDENNNTIPAPHVAPSAGGGSGYVKNENGTSINGETSVVEGNVNVLSNPASDGNGHGRITYLPSYSFSITGSNGTISPEGNNTITIQKSTQIQISLKDAQNQFVNDATWTVKKNSSDLNNKDGVTFTGNGNVRTFSSDTSGTYVITASNPNEELINTSVKIIVEGDDASTAITGNASNNAPNNAKSNGNTGEVSDSSEEEVTEGKNAGNTEGTIEESADSTAGGETNADSQNGSASSSSSVNTSVAADESSSKKTGDDRSDQSIVSSSSS